MTTPFPGALVPAVGDRPFNPIWILYLQQFASQPGPIQPVVLGPSPASFTASGAGSLALSGGTVSGVTLRRGTVVASVPGGLVPMANNDVVTVTYSAAPTASFIPG